MSTGDRQTPADGDHAGAVLSSVVTSAADAVIACDRQGRITLWNPAAERIYGYRWDEVHGRRVMMLYPPEVADRDRRVFDRALAGEPTPQLETARQRRDGQVVPMRMSFAPIVEADATISGVVSIAHELTQELREQARMAALLRASPDAVMGVGADGLISFTNESCDRMLGYEPQELIGRPARTLFTHDMRQAMIDLRTQLFTDPALRAETRTIATRMLRKDGSVFAAETTISWLHDARDPQMITATRDLTALRRAESKLHNLLEVIPEAITGIGRDWRIALVNEATERLVGQPRTALLGRPYVELLPDASRDAVHQTFVEVFDAAPGSSPRTVYADVIRADGNRMVTENTVAHLIAEDEEMLVVAGRDITDRLAAEAERAELVAQVARQKAEQAAQGAQRMESLGQLAGGVAHDFNNLLAIVLNYASLLGSDIADLAEADPQRWQSFADDLTKIEHAAQRGAALTQQLLLFSRRDVNQPQVLDPATVLNNLRPLLHSAIGEQNRLHVDIQPNLPAVRLDPGQLEQILVNIAVNSRDAMPHGGNLRITADAGLPSDDDPGYQPEPDASQTYLRLRITDDGHGMPAEVAQRAFEPFFTTKPKGRGTGLGLATVYGIISQANGCLRLQSEPDAGTTVTVLLPVTDEQPPTHTGRTTTSGDARSTPQRTVLLVDDEEGVRESTARVLTRHGYHVLTAADGQQALNLARQHEANIDILLTDMIMPNMHGAELAEHVTALIPTIQVIYMSGYAEPLVNTRHADDQSIYLLEKPFTASALIDALTTAN
ncbi:PAS domain S-box protein [Actinoplanes sp. NPDC020271]|uniref:PAS domain S-box protein n=1 Tax=Actinoplanes sp. NPDC020271 TaxID=3363896 RepID=UPI0037B6BBAB